MKSVHKKVIHLNKDDMLKFQIKDFISNPVYFDVDEGVWEPVYMIVYFHMRWEILGDIQNGINAK